MRLKWIFVCGCFAGIWSTGICQDKSGYIESYKDIAIAEMERTGIPASIKLAQAILESSCGKSDLACKANNHFGIKCGNDWKGKSYRKEDDDYENGKLVKSCFREFSSVYDSYIAHSDFLLDPNKTNRYSFLFDLDATDYKGWAKGLSKAGYATDPNYAQRLIDIIEKNELYQYDSRIPEKYASRERKTFKLQSTTRYHNDVRYVVAAENETPETVASRNDISVRQIIRYNDDIDREDQVLVAGSRIYLQPKRNQNNGKQKVHLLKPGENLIAISQQYGIKLEALQKRNGLNPNEVPAPNQKLVLKGKSKTKVRTVNPYSAPPVLPANDPAPVVSENATASITTTTPIRAKETKPDTSKAASTTKPAATTKPAPTTKPIVVEKATVMVPNTSPSHTVAKGDTLYGISRHYGIPVTELKKMNNLSVDTISIGQKLLLR